MEQKEDSQIRVWVCALFGRELPAFKIGTAVATAGVARLGAGRIAGGLIETELVEASAASRVASAAESAQKFLGPNSRAFQNAAGDKIFESADGLRQIRFDFLKPDPHFNPHIQIEVFRNFKNIKIPVIHKRIFPIDFLPF